MPTTSSDLKPAVVSVVIPCYNAGRWIHQAVASALAHIGVQTEVIVVDDGSSDQSREVLRTFAQRIRILENPVRGGNVARNAGLAAATGEWVQFLDADDYLDPEKITRQLAEAGDLTSADVLYSPVWIETWHDGKPTHREASPLNASTDLFTQWITWQLPQTGGALWRRSALLALGGWKKDQPCCQEHELYLRALHAGLRFRFCPTPGAIYRIWSESTVCRKDPLLVIRERTRLITLTLTWLDSRGNLTPSHTRAAGEAIFAMARTWAKRDPAGAPTYYEHYRTRGLIHVSGPAAPRGYRLALRCFGFSRAEKLARLLR